MPNQSCNQSQVTFTKRGVLRGVGRLAPISIFVIPFGMAFGIAAVENGLTSVQALIMSATVFSGAAQFASLEYWPNPTNLLSITIVMFAVNARHIMTGAALAPWVNQLPIGPRWFALAFLSDPNFADSRPAFQAGEKDVGVLLGGGLVLWVNWVAGTAVGVFVGAQVGELRTYGFDVVMVCFFASSIAGKLKQTSNLAPALLAAGIAVLTQDALPPGWNIVSAAIAGGLLGVVYGK